MRRIVCAIAFFCAGAFADVPASERAALVDLYDATGGPSWTQSRNWLKGDPCVDKWGGIVCTPSPGRRSGGVKVNDTRRSNLLRPVSKDDAQEEAGDVDHVYHLNLAQNNLQGTLPESFGDLTSVSWIALDIFNSLTGTIPASIGKMTDVTLFTIAGSAGGTAGDKFSGMIPSGICSLTNMFIFHAGSNRFTGVPDCFCDLTISNCDLSGNPLQCSQTPDCAKTICGATCT